MTQLAFAHLGNMVVCCPVLGDIHTKTCAKYKRLAITNKIIADRLYLEAKETCNTCTRG